MGGGKTWSILVDNLQGIHDPAYFSVFFRTTTVEIDKGLWPEAKLMYLPYLTDANGKFVGRAHISEKTKTITFPSGARTAFAYLSSDRDADSWYGSELTKIYLDESQFRSQYQFEVLKSRNRSRANVTKGIRCTLNPDPTSFIYEWVQPYLCEDDFPIPELSGKTRYYTQLDGKLISSWDADEVRQLTGKEPETYTYIPSTLADNKKLELLDPTYRNKLDAMPEAKRKQLLLGCWSSTEDSGVYFKREYLKKATEIPLAGIMARGYDLAATADDTPNTQGCDQTASVLMKRTRDGYYYILSGNSYRKRSGDRDNEIIRQGYQDGDDVQIVIPCDHGAGGKAAFDYLAKALSDASLICKKDPSVGTHSKLKKAEPFLTACQNGLVYIVESSWDKIQLEQFYRELEQFDGVKKSTRTRHEDYLDAAASAFAYLNQQKQHTVPKLGLINSPTAKAVANL